MKNKDNFLDQVFGITDGLKWQADDSGQVVVDMENRGFTNRIAQKFFNKPAVSHITLEGMGSYIFTCIDGRRSVYDIGILVRDKFGEEAEPLYERLSVYIKHLESVGFATRVL